MNLAISCRFGLDFLYETGIQANFINGLGNWIADNHNSEIIPGISEENVLRIRSDEFSPGYAIINFPFGQAGSIDLVLHTDVNFQQGVILLSEYYLDRENLLSSRYRKR